MFINKANQRCKNSICKTKREIKEISWLNLIKSTIRSLRPAKNLMPSGQTKHLLQTITYCTRWPNDCTFFSFASDGDVNSLFAVDLYLFTGFSAQCWYGFPSRLRFTGCLRVSGEISRTLFQEKGSPVLFHCIRFFWASGSKAGSNLSHAECL